VGGSVGARGGGSGDAAVAGDRCAHRGQLGVGERGGGVDVSGSWRARHVFAIISGGI
jgi:hypothetical protein